MKRRRVLEMCYCDFYDLPHPKTQHCRLSREEINRQVEEEWNKRLDDRERARDMAEAGGVPLK